MSLHDRMKRVFDVPSRRGGKDYSKKISPRTVQGTLLVFRDYVDPHGSGYPDGFHHEWMRKAVRDLEHVYHSFVGADLDGGLGAFAQFLNLERSTEAFLDFLETSLRHAPNDNEFVRALNRVLEEYDSPYLLSEYVVRKVPFENTKSYYTQVDRHPQAYLKHSSEVQEFAVEPALKILSDPAYKAPAEQFQTALRRQREGDYDGCVTACYSAVEGTIKVAAAKLRIRKLKGNSLDSLAQSFIAKTSLPDMSQGLFRDLSDWRNTEADAHGHATNSKVTEGIAQYFIAKAAALVALVQSQVK